MHWKKTAMALAAVAMSLSMAACGQAQVPGTPVPGEPPATLQPQVEGAPSIRTSSSALGTILTDGEGITLYRFDTDTAKPPKSNCGDDCAAAWPPVHVEDATSITVDGVAKDLLGTVVRDDGRTQLTVAGWPAYRYSKDTEPGDTKGHGAGGKWFAFSADGKKAAGSADDTAVVRLAVMRIAGLGPVVTDREGMTLYRFDRDRAKPSKSTCGGECAERWPPLLVPAGAELVVDGLDKADVGVVVRPDGTRQATAGGWPLYRYAGDKVPCDTRGHGAAGTWFAAAPDGSKANG